ncbi:unnamed protein product, partial [Mesorhabditis belari]|uniref:Carboxylic ester hydrolase n=1 Tax=Mesorhabditis belari TaxID=2138241 RepID=A0AAF3EG99_9BILA
MSAQRADPRGFINATGYAAACAQQWDSNSQEDCLYINVFTPVNMTSAAKLPVFVWIYGGGFVGGNGNLGAGMYSNLINRGPLIVVSMNYRVGAFGFLTTRTYDAPGNAGISDVLEALNWVQRYISFFGGDPTKVTVGGQSAGSEAASFVSLSPWGLGLYRGLILESGSAFGAALMSYSEKTRNTTKDLAIRLGCTTSADYDQGRSFHDIVLCLQSKKAASIMSVDDQLPNHRMKWAPVQDTNILPQRLENLARLRQQVPVLVGDVKDEWVGWDQSLITNNLKWFTKGNVENSLSSSYEMTYWDKQDDVTKACLKKYTENQPFSDTDSIQWASTHIRLFSEMVFVGPALRDAKYFSYTGSDVFLYSFDYLNPAAIPEENITALRGVPHGWELQYIFNDGHSWPTTDNDTKTTELMGKLWTNFVLYGNPTPANGLKTGFTWPTLSAAGDTNEYVSLGPDAIVSKNYHPSAMFWVCDAPTIDGWKPQYCA